MEKKDFKKKKFFILLFIIILINYNVYIKKRSKNFQPKISIFLPIYNKEEFLKKSIRSIQKQTLNDIEIIPINDCSEDNSLEVLKKMSKRDSRIKIINNDRNRGLLYSRAMGILNSKGEYIMNLDPDDELVGRDNLEYLYKIINKLKVDVISFGYIIKKPGKTPIKNFLCTNFKNIQFQPEILNSNIDNFDFLIWNKLVKKRVFKKAYFFFKDKIYGEKWNYAEDEIWSILINKYARTKICIGKTIYKYNINNLSLMSNTNNILYIKNIINWIEILKIILIYKNEKIYLNRFNTFIKIIENNRRYIGNISNFRKINNKYFNIFRNIAFKIEINNETLKYVIDSLKNKVMNISS